MELNEQRHNCRKVLLVSTAVLMPVSHDTVLDLRTQIFQLRSYFLPCQEGRGRIVQRWAIW